MTQRELTRLTGIAPSNMMKLYHGESKYIYFDTLEKICTALNVTICDLFEIVPDGKAPQVGASHSEQEQGSPSRD